MKEKSRGATNDKKQGKDSESSLAPSFLTALTEKAARQNNELV